MPAAYAFDVDPRRDYIQLRMSGFFMPEDIDEFSQARHAAHARLTCAAHAHVTLVDLREMKIQSQEAVAGFGQMLATSGYFARRLAFVVAPGLLRTQLLRIVTERDDVRCFESQRMAEGWLFSPQISAPIQQLVGTVPLRLGA